MKLRGWCFVVLTVCGLAVGVLNPAAAVHARTAGAEVSESSSFPTDVRTQGGSGIAAAIACGGFARLSIDYGMHPGVVSAAIASCFYMVLDALFDFPY
jgi:hypothetical protein